MRRLLLSDIHSNMEAFDACMERAERFGFDDVLCTGDIVGYGPEPNEAIGRIIELGAAAIRGNHDRVASGQDDGKDFNADAKAAIQWTRKRLSRENQRCLLSLPIGPRQVGHEAQLVHGAVTDEDEYIMSEAHAGESFRRTETRITFFGHTHYPTVFSRDGSGDIVLEVPEKEDDFQVFELKPGMQYLVNPGSVGQPRDNDTRSAFAVWDVDRSRVEFHRVRYPFERTQEKMRKAGLPRYLIDRLEHGR